MKIVQVKDASSLFEFYCGISEIDNFLHGKFSTFIEADACKAFVVYDNHIPVAVYALGCDSLELSPQENLDVVYSNHKPIDVPNQFIEDFEALRSHPAIEISLLAVSLNHQKKRLGSAIVQHIRKMALNQNIAGCQFLTVSPYEGQGYSAEGFYESIGFKKVNPVSSFGNQYSRMYLPLRIWEYRPF